MRSRIRFVLPNQKAAYRPRPQDRIEHDAEGPRLLRGMRRRATLLPPWLNPGSGRGWVAKLGQDYLLAALRRERIDPRDDRGCPLAKLGHGRVAFARERKAGIDSDRHEI